VLGAKGLDVGDPLGGRTPAPVVDVEVALAEPATGHHFADHATRVSIRGTEYSITWHSIPARVASGSWEQP
jgi:hypothetical protein